MNQEILPCPFCGSSDLTTQLGTEDREGFPVSLVCTDCGASGPWDYLRDKDVSKIQVAKETLWNQRKEIK